MENAEPIPPSFAELEQWAGAGRVIRASAADLEGWQVPKEQRAALLTCGVPMIEGILDAVSFRTEGRLYRVAEMVSDLPGCGWIFSVEPETGRVLQSSASGGPIRLVNSSVSFWLCSLHVVGTWLATSVVIDRWDEDEEHEQAALEEIEILSARIGALDPPACRGADHDAQFWPAVLDRWLY